MWRKKLNLSLLILVFGPALLTIIWFKNGHLLGAGESGLLFYDLGQALEITKFAWAESALGNNVGVGVAATPTYFMLSLLQWAGIPSFLIQALFFWLIFVIAGISVYLLTRQLFSKIPENLALLAALFYWFNPASLVNVWNRFLYNFMVFWALLPLALFLFLKGIERRDFRFSILIGLVSLVFSYAATSNASNLLLWFLLFFTTIFYLFTGQNKKFLLKFFSLTFLFWVLVNFWWISQLLSFVISGAITPVVSAFFTTEGNLSTLTALSQRLGNLVDTTRLMHGTFFAQPSVPWAAIFESLPLKILEFATTGLILAMILRYRRIRQVLFCGLLFFIGLFLAKGNSPPYGGLFQFIFIHFQFFQVFRNPFEKFGFLLPLAASPLFAFGIYSLMTNLKFGWRKLLPTLVFVTVLGFFGFPFWSRFVFTGPKSSDTDQIRGYEVVVPDYYQRINNWLKNERENFRLLILPLSGEGITQAWQLGYSGVESSSILFGTPSVSFNTTIPFYNQVVGELEELFFTKEDFPKVAALLNTKYILVRSDIDFRERRIRDPGEIEERLKEKDFDQIAAFDKLSLFELPQESFLPRIYPTSSLVSVGPDLTIKDFIRVDGKIGEAIYQISEEKILGTRATLVRPSQDAFFASRKVYQTGEALDQLLFVRHLPTDLIYPLVLLKERLDRSGINDADGQLIFDINLLGKRAAEIYKLVQARREDAIKSAAQKYITTLSSLLSTLRKEVLEDPTSGVTALLIDTFAKHKAVLSGARGEAEGPGKEVIRNLEKELSEKMQELGVETVYPLVGEVENRWVYRFAVSAEGEYEVVLERRFLEFHQDFPGEVNLQLDERLIKSPPVLTDEWVKFGKVFLAEGIHEISFKIPDSLSLVKSEEPFSLTSDKNMNLSFEIEPFTPYAQYEVSFDYWIKRGNRLMVKFDQNVDPVVDGEVLSQNTRELNPDGYLNDFRNVRFIVKPDGGASSAQVSFGVEPWSGCPKTRIEALSPCRDKEYKKLFDRSTEVVIKSLTVKKVFDNKLALFKEEPSGRMPLPKVSFTRIDPTKYEVSVEEAGQPFILVFSELFNPGWQAVFADGQKAEKHFLVNAYANGWLIEKTGTFNLTLKFTPQDLLKSGQLISLISFLGGVFYLGGSFLWKRRL